MFLKKGSRNITLYPKGVVLGFCAGQPVYPRTCVQSLHTARQWLQEWLQIKKGETPAKVWTCNIFCSEGSSIYDNFRWFSFEYIISHLWYLCNNVFFPGFEAFTKSSQGMFFQSYIIGRWLFGRAQHCNVWEMQDKDITVALYCGLDCAKVDC